MSVDMTTAFLDTSLEEKDKMSLAILQLWRLGALSPFYATIGFSSNSGSLESA
jgi:hypothetical protein